eukprot:TRINITY_DN35609_c0_g1_i2.p2 TRINITY_DN35609_c0_g1~~TRINITY_DN35609_c0_g1_i2.p2  ORF type:complete len:289 (+),score=73.57 TRINITY_DN35609_c0_g1_i2:71-868(+)
MWTARCPGLRRRLARGASAAAARHSAASAEALIRRVRPEGWQHPAQSPSDTEAALSPEELSGELTIAGLERILEWADAHGQSADGGLFWDLGSGCGDMPAAAALMRGFALCGGVELRAALHREAVALAGLLEGCRALERGRLRFFCGDMRSEAAVAQWAAADLLLVHATAFGAELLGDVAVSVCGRSPVGSVVVTVSKELPGVAGSGAFEQLGSRPVQTEYGECEAFLCRKVRPCSPAELRLVAAAVAEAVADEEELAEGLAGLG